MQGYGLPVRPIAFSAGATNGDIVPMQEDIAGASPPRIAAQTLQAGEVVDVFHRYCQDPNGYFMVQNKACGLLHPSIGCTDGWTEGRISEDWKADQYDPSDYKTWVEIQWQHELWYNRRGHKLDTANVQMITQRVMPEQIRKRDAPSEAQQEPLVTLIHIRWGGDQPVNPVTEGQGGWGQIGSTPSDNYINGWEDSVWNTIGPRYEIISVFFQGSDELNKISPAFLRSMAKAKHVGAFYFMWPITYQDGHEFPAYVDRDRQLKLMIEMEASGVSTRFPHSAHLYRMFASKEWTAQLCLHPLLRVPLTTQVPRQAMAVSCEKAAAGAIKALNKLSEARSQFTEACGQGSFKAAQIQNGVAKLGWSWEAMDVQAWKSKQELTTALASLVEQPGSQVDQVFVQEWVDFDVEIRHFIVEPDLRRPETLKPKKKIYTIFKSKEGGSFRNFQRYDREECIKHTFHQDEAAMDHADTQCDELIVRWMQWLQAQSHELPPVCRIDILVKRTEKGKAAVTTGELTELGGCFLGWPEGPKTVFAAMLRSVFKEF